MLAKLRLLSLCLLLTSCATVEVGIPADAVSYDSDLTPDAIVGIWTKAWSQGGAESVQTMIFSPDGTGFNRAKMTGFDADIQEKVSGKNLALTWRYAGGGWWDVNMEMPDGIPNQDLKYRVASDPEAGPSLYWITDGRAIQLTKVSEP